MVTLEELTARLSRLGSEQATLASLVQKAAERGNASDVELASLRLEHLRRDLVELEACLEAQVGASGEGSASLALMGQQLALARTMREGTDVLLQQLERLGQAQRTAGKLQSTQGTLSFAEKLAQFEERRG